MTGCRAWQEEWRVRGRAVRNGAGHGGARRSGRGLAEWGVAAQSARSGARRYEQAVCPPRQLAPTAVVTSAVGDPFPPSLRQVGVLSDRLVAPRPSPCRTSDHRGRSGRQWRDGTPPRRRMAVSGAVEDAYWRRQHPCPWQQVTVSDGRDGQRCGHGGRGWQGRATPQGSAGRGLEYGGALWDAATGHGRQGPRRR